MKRLAVFGAGGHTEEFRSLSGLDFDIFVDDEYVTNDYKSLSDFDPNCWKVIICVGESAYRKRIADRFPDGTEFFTYVHPTSVIGTNVTVGEGSYIGPFCVVTTNVSLGRHTLLNRGVHIGHDCRIGSFFSAMPCSVVSGNNEIGDCVYLGTNSSTRQKIKIADNVTVGMGSALVSSAESPGKYVGVPAKKKPKLSVIIPCYNFEDYIKTAIDSVLDQKTDFDFEVIIGDDFSKDSSYEIIRSYGNKVRHYRNDRNIGPFENIKKLMSLCEGDYISHLDGDDYFTDTSKSQKQVDFLEANPEYSMHATGCVYGERDGKPTDINIVPLVEVVTTKELTGMNLVGFGRTFRNYRNIVKEWMRDVYYLDWCINVELSLSGIIKCDSWQSGVYRLTGDGMITGKSNSEIELLNIECRNALSKRVDYHKYES